MTPAEKEVLHWRLVYEQAARTAAEVAAGARVPPLAVFTSVAWSLHEAVRAGRMVLVEDRERPF